MDFLDPKKRRAHKNRLITGYFLVGIAIALGTVILVYGAYGYGINTKTGDVVENGLLFTGSQPGGAGVYLNGSNQNKSTPARLVLSAGEYELAMKKDGYHDWSRKFTLDGHGVRRFLYPLLIPLNPKITDVKNYEAVPQLVTQSPDKRRLLVQQPLTSSLEFSFEEYDTSNIDQDPRAVEISGDLLSSESQQSKLSAVEWSSDSNYLLLRHQYAGGAEFIIFDRRTPANSINLNTLFETAPSQVALRDQKIDQVYIYNQKDQTLRVGDVGEEALRPIFLQNVLAFKSHGPSLISYVSDQGVVKGKVEARIWDNGQNYPFYTFTAGTRYIIDASQFQGHWYYIAGSDKTDRINVFKDPLDSLSNEEIGLAVPMITLRISGATQVDFSQNSRFVAVQAGQRLAVYDFEGLERYQYSLPSKLAGTAHWMDGHRFIAATNGKITIFDYDGTNQQSLGSTNQNAGGYFDSDFNHLFTFSARTKAKPSALQDIDMRAGSDLPE